VKGKKKFIRLILADPHPEKIEDYAIQLFYKANNHSFFTCSDAKAIDDKGQWPFGSNNELARLVIEGDVYIVNTRTGNIKKK
jgi:hypothetical protein